MPRRILPLLCALLAACASPLQNAAENTVSVYKSRGALQCERGGLSVSELEKQLKDAGIRVQAATCGHDGRMRPAMCGRPDGAIAIFEIPAAQLEAATALKFAPLERAQGASRSACS